MGTGFDVARLDNFMCKTAQNENLFDYRCEQEKRRMFGRLMFELIKATKSTYNEWSFKRTVGDNDSEKLIIRVPANVHLI